MDSLGRSSSAKWETITSVEHALVVPAAGKKKAAVFSTVVDKFGAPVVDALNFRLNQFEPPHFIDRRTTNPAIYMPGSYLYAGFFWHHFGHFLFESTARLWAVDQLRGKIDGIVFMRTKPFLEVGAQIQKILHHLDIDIPLIFVDEPTEFELLYVPRQSCGMGALAAGTPVFREFMQSKLRRIPARDGPKKIYLTREGYGLRRGGHFAETHIRELLEAEGYAAFSPQEHSFEDQIATYLGADIILGPDSSAMHLVGFVANSQTKIAILLRRRDGEKDMLPQLTAFTRRPPIVINAIKRMYRRSVVSNETWSVFAELDLPELWAKLRSAKLIETDESWQPQRENSRANLFAYYEKKLGCGLDMIWER